MGGSSLRMAGSGRRLLGRGHGSLVPWKPCLVASFESPGRVTILIFLTNSPQLREMWCLLLDHVANERARISISSSPLEEKGMLGANRCRSRVTLEAEALPGTRTSVFHQSGIETRKVLCLSLLERRKWSL